MPFTLTKTECKVLDDWLEDFEKSRRALHHQIIAIITKLESQYNDGKVTNEEYEDVFEVIYDWLDYMPDGPCILRSLDFLEDLENDEN
jgi:hypothetical protein